MNFGHPIIIHHPFYIIKNPRVLNPSEGGGRDFSV